ncbi:MAG TPA: hypothetical protein VJU87_10855 [Gemmatimonadaceae bacterium]|nr:hypothetical protein [Gemmatimonadaceae bacterium]
MFNGMPRRRALGLATAALLAMTTGACNDFLQVKNPGAIQEQDVDNPAYISLLVNGVIGEFQPAFSSTALYSGIFTDELANFHGFSENIDIDRRAVGVSNGTYAGGVYTPLQSARFMADTVASLLRSFLGDSAARDVRLARSLDYAGYAYTLLAEQMCSAPINGGASESPDQLFGTALARFNDAIQVATAASTNAATSAANKRSADSLLTLAQIGAARVSLDLGKAADAIGFATPVATNPALDSTWGFRVYHSANTSREYDPFYAAASGGASAEYVGITNTPYETLVGDPRIPHPTTTEKTQQGDAIVPNSPLMFSTYNGTATGADFTRDASITFASKLEARYILAEAQGQNATNLAFLNSRRAIGGDTPLVAPTDADYMAALREQRARDLYLAGYRLGDLRRYIRLYKVDLFQTGTFKSPVPAPPTFGDQTCWPIPQAEYTGNHNLPSP